jgi:uncharacterized membrane protein
LNLAGGEGTRGCVGWELEEAAELAWKGFARTGRGGFPEKRKGCGERNVGRNGQAGWKPAAEFRVDVDPKVTPKSPRRRRASFAEDFRRFFVRGMAALLPTLITLWLLVKLWEFLWEALGRHIIYVIRLVWLTLVERKVLPEQPALYIKHVLSSDLWWVQVLGVLLAVLLVYVVGVFVGNFIGRQFWRLGELAAMRVPLVRAIYPAVKQVTDLFLADRTGQFAGSRVVAVQHRAQEVWTIGLVMGPGIRALSEMTGDETVSVFVPSTPTAFSGYVVLVPRQNVVELPISVEDAMRLLVSGGVLAPTGKKKGGMTNDEVRMTNEIRNSNDPMTKRSDLEDGGAPEALRLEGAAEGREV